MHFTYDGTLIALGTKTGRIILLETKNILQFDPKVSDLQGVDKKEIRHIKAVKKGNETDLYFSTEDSFFCNEKLN